MRTPRSLAISRTSDAERAEDPPGSVVAERGGVVREPGEIDEGEGARNAHAPPRVAGRSVGRVLSWQLGSPTPVGTARRRGFELDADGLFDELTDDLLYHGDVNRALRRMMQEGMRDRNGERLQGLRELMDKLRQQRQDRLDQFDLGGVYSEIADELNDIVDEERHAIDNATQAAERSGDERRAADRPRRRRRSQLPPRHAARRSRRQGPRAAGLRLRVGRGARSASSS